MKTVKKYMNREILRAGNTPGKFLVSGAITLVLMSGVLLAQVEPDTVKLNDLVAEALVNNPRLESFYLASRADSFNIPQAGALPDPMLSLNLLSLPVNTFAFDQEPMTGKQIALKQTFPFPGKQGLKERISSEKASLSRAGYEEYRNQLVRDVELNYYELYYADRAIETTLRNQELMRGFVNIAETRYSVGKGLQQDVLKAQVELSRLTDRLITLQQKRLVIQTALNGLLNRPAESRIGHAEEIEFTKINTPPDSLRRKAETSRPYLAGWQAMERQSSLRRDLAKKEYLPDFSIFLAYTQREELQMGGTGVDFLSGGISFDLPLYFWQKQDNMVEEMSLNSQAVTQRYSSELSMVRQELENSFTSSQKNAELIELYKNGIIPQASQALESAITGYQTGKVDFLTLVSSQMTLFSYQLEYYRALSDYRRDVARLEFTVGEKLVGGQ